MDKIKGLDNKHTAILNRYLQFVQKQVYNATELSETGKFAEFQEVLNEIIIYSNDFEDIVNQDLRSREEWAFMIPSYTLFASMGFYTGLKRKNNEDKVEECLDRTSRATMNAVGEISDLIKEELEVE